MFALLSKDRCLLEQRKNLNRLNNQPKPEIFSEYTHIIGVKQIVYFVLCQCGFTIDPDLIIFGQNY